jgi:hypothetical protein
MSNYNYFNKNTLGSLDKYFVPMSHVISSSNTQYGGAGNGFTPRGHPRAVLPFPLSQFHVGLVGVVSSTPSPSGPSSGPPSPPPPTPPNSTLVTRISNTGYPIRYDSINDATPVIHSDTKEYLNQTFKEKTERRTYEAEQNQRRIKDAVSYGPRNKLSAVFGNNLFEGTNKGVAVANAMTPANKSTVFTSAAPSDNSDNSDAVDTTVITSAAPSDNSDNSDAVDTTVITSAAPSDNSDNSDNSDDIMDFDLFGERRQTTEQTTKQQLMAQLEQSRRGMSN